MPGCSSSRLTFFDRPLSRYPRTESTRLPKSFSVGSVCLALGKTGTWKGLAEMVMAAAGECEPTPPTGGVDAGDHPPITPTGSNGSGSPSGSDERRLSVMLIRFRGGDWWRACTLRSWLASEGLLVTFTSVPYSSDRYDAVVRHFLATLLPDCMYSEIKTLIEVGGVPFRYTHHEIDTRGWLAAQPWREAELGPTPIPVPARLTSDTTAAPAIR